MPEPSSPPVPAAVAPGLWKFVRAFGTSCVVAGMTVINAANALENSERLLWLKTAIALGAVGVAVQQGWSLRTYILAGGPGARRGSAESFTSSFTSGGPPGAPSDD